MNEKEKIPDFDFDQWSRIAREEPEKFEAMRQDMINQLIAQAFRVQIAAYGERMKPSFFQERGIENYVETTDQLGLYRYFAGAYKTRDEAEVVRKEVAAKGFPYALIIDLEEQDYANRKLLFGIVT